MIKNDFNDFSRISHPGHVRVVVGVDARHVAEDAVVGGGRVDAVSNKGNEYRVQ